MWQVFDIIAEFVPVSVDPFPCVHALCRIIALLGLACSLPMPSPCSGVSGLARVSELALVCTRRHRLTAISTMVLGSALAQNMGWNMVKGHTIALTEKHCTAFYYLSAARSLCLSLHERTN